MNVQIECMISGTAAAVLTWHRLAVRGRLRWPVPHRWRAIMVWVVIDATQAEAHIALMQLQDCIRSTAQAIERLCSLGHAPAECSPHERGGSCPRTDRDSPPRPDDLRGHTLPV